MTSIARVLGFADAGSSILFQETEATPYPFALNMRTKQNCCSRQILA